MEAIQKQKNTRVRAVDFARGLSVLLMILIHTMLIYGSIHTQTKTVAGTIALWLGRGTPMFLVTMGISFVLSRRQTFTAVCKRAVYILGVGYGMNLLKFLIPEYLFSGLPEAFVKAYGLTSQTLESAAFFLLLGDILQLAGLTLFIMAVINHYSKNKYVPLMIALAIVAVSKELSGFRFNITGIDYLCDLLFSNQFNVYFPVFPWSAFILIGMFLGRWFKEMNENQNVFFKKMAILGIGFLAVGGIFNFIDPEYHFGDYYHLGPGGCILLIGVNLLFLWITNFFVSFIEDSSTIFRFLSFCSKNVTSMYVIQWTLINWGMYLFGFWRHDALTVMLLVPVMIILTVLVQKAWLIIKKKAKPSQIIASA
ncbi:DUF1624 domain-containing protein [Flavobacterium amniphilum]|uniref:heparan-alpha-glucosaminide N-acetyltransferase domain-containing protein n=1 Tax=Flavobacterium amniphilum TaxID=1834035 RepID=UPI00202A6CFD|nr:heparan-alpha-glucosaminide N-acetyltransferase domain-containing protein [Flavobacterium amniphilum]MCL9804543.1 DUF1624 domain-containing protein [Flavobacterium amniphilum]